MENSLRNGNTRPPDVPPEKSVFWSGRTVKTRHGTKDWFQIGKDVCKGCILSPCLVNLYAEYTMRNAGWRKHNLESRLLGEILITSDMTPLLWQKVKKN